MRKKTCEKQKQNNTRVRKSLRNKQLYVLRDKQKEKLYENSKKKKLNSFVAHDCMRFQPILLIPL